MHNRLWHVARGKRIVLSLIISCWLFLTLAGCATLKEWGKGFAGVSTKVLEDGRDEAISMKFNADYDTCLKKSEEILARIGTYTYARDASKQMIAVFLSEEDTTPVGVFFSKFDEKSTLIEVSSPSTFARETISTKLFSFLEKWLVAQEQGVSFDIQKVVIE
ncbi:hypothetical protein ACFLZ3_01380 [Candidatus Omnitrophota bacterium]